MMAVLLWGLLKVDIDTTEYTADILFFKNGTKPIQPKKILIPFYTYIIL